MKLCLILGLTMGLMMGLMLGLATPLLADAPAAPPADAGEPQTEASTSDHAKAANHATPTSDARPAAPEPPAVRTGTYTLQFNDRHPLSRLSVMAERFQWELDGSQAEYDLAAVSFEVYVPSGYQADGSYGLLVFISPEDSGQVPAMWKPVLDQQKLIWIGAKGAGNEADIWKRLGLALDATQNMQRQFVLDRNRLYVAGFSGGGRAASRLGLMYPDVLRGTMPMMGCDFYRNLAVPDREGMYWRAGLAKPGRLLWQLGRTQMRFVLVTGEDDANRPAVHAAFEHGFKADRYQHATYLEIPNLGHEYPPAQAFAQALSLLDPGQTRKIVEAEQAQVELDHRAAAAIRHAVSLAEVNPTRGYQALERIARQHADTPAADEARRHMDQLTADPQQRDRIQRQLAMEEARQSLNLAENYHHAGRHDLARALLEDIIANHPDLPQAQQAQTLLAKLPTPEDDDADQQP